MRSVEPAVDVLSLDGILRSNPVRKLRTGAVYSGTGLHQRRERNPVRKVPMPFNCSPPQSGLEPFGAPASHCFPLPNGNS